MTDRPTAANSEQPDHTPRGSSRSFALIALCIGTVLALAVSELVIRMVLPPPALYQGHSANVPGLVSAVPVRGYSWTPEFDDRMVSPDFDNRYVISSQGLRDVEVLADDRRRILALGDSFTGGEGVEAGESWPKRLQVALNAQQAPGDRLRVINAGVTGYSARQMRQAAEHHVPVFQPEHVVIGIYPHGADRVENPFVLFGDHLVRQREIANMQQRPDGYIWYHSNFHSNWLAALDLWAQRNLYFVAYALRLVDRGSQMLGLGANSKTTTTPPVTTRLQPVFDELLLLQEYLRSRDVGLTVLIVSGQAGSGEFAEDTKAMATGLQEFCEEAGLSVVNPLRLLEDEANGKPVFRFPGDGHWTPPAHDLAAIVLAESLQASGALAVQSSSNGI